MNSEMLRQPARFLNPRNKIEVSAFSRSTQFAGDKEDVAGLAAMPKNAAIFFHRTGDTDGNDRGPLVPLVSPPTIATSNRAAARSSPR